MTQVSPFEVKNNTLYVKGTPVAFRYPIYASSRITGFDNIYSVILDVKYPPERPEDFTRNVYGVDQNGCIVWRIQPVQDVTGDMHPFTGYYAGFDTGELRVHTGFGHVYKVDPTNGKIEYLFWRKY